MRSQTRRGRRWSHSPCPRSCTSTSTERSRGTLSRPSRTWTCEFLWTSTGWCVVRQQWCGKAERREPLVCRLAPVPTRLEWKVQKRRAESQHIYLLCEWDPAALLPAPFMVCSGDSRIRALGVLSSRWASPPLAKVEELKYTSISLFWICILTRVGEGKHVKGENWQETEI